MLREVQPMRTISLLRPLHSNPNNGFVGKRRETAREANQCLSSFGGRFVRFASLWYGTSVDLSRVGRVSLLCRAIGPKARLYYGVRTQCGSTFGVLLYTKRRGRDEPHTATSITQCSGSLGSQQRFAYLAES